MSERCSFCGRDTVDCPGGFWHLGCGEWPEICRYCARAALRSFGELPPAEPVGIFSRREIDPETAA